MKKLFLTLGLALAGYVSAEYCNVTIGGWLDKAVLGSNCSDLSDTQIVKQLNGQIQIGSISGDNIPVNVYSSDGSVLLKTLSINVSPSNDSNSSLAHVTLAS